MNTRCIITGCNLHLEHGQDGVPGDLHLQGDTFIFNGNMEPHLRGAHWLPADLLLYSMSITIPMGYDYFERHGVFVMKASRRLLNELAQAYTAKTAPNLPA